jgi:hypothetical protein
VEKWSWCEFGSIPISGSVDIVNAYGRRAIARRWMA